MNTPDTGNNSRPFWIVRAILLGIGGTLIVWALIDDTMIGGGFGFGATQMLVAVLGACSIIASALPARFAATGFLLLISFFISIVIMELVLSQTLRARYFSAFQFDERALFKLRPGATREFTHIPANGGETLLYRINSDGYRGPELISDTDPIRIVVYGDSFIQAEFTRLEDTFPMVLQTELANHLAVQVEVVNAGVAGYGPDQVLRRMEADLDRLMPDFVIFSVFSGNDFGDLLRNKLYKIGPAGDLVENRYELSAEQQRQIELNRNEMTFVRMLRETIRALRGQQENHQGFDREAWIDGALEQHIREYREYVEEGNNYVGTFAVDPYSVDIAAFQDQASAKYKIELMHLVVAGIADQLNSRSIPLHAMVIPHPMDVKDGDHASGYIDRTKFPDYDPRRLSDSIGNILQELGVPHTNLYNVFKIETVDNLYLKGGDDHWNENGQRIAAQVIAKEILPFLSR